MMNAGDLLKVLRDFKELLSNKKKEILIGTYLRYKYSKINRDNSFSLLSDLTAFSENEELRKIYEFVVDKTPLGKTPNPNLFFNDKNIALFESLMSNFKNYDKKLLKLINRYKLPFERFAGFHIMFDFKEPDADDVLNKFYDYLLKKISNKLREIIKKKKVSMLYPAIGSDWLPAKYFELIALDIDERFIKKLKKITKNKIKSYVVMDIKDYEKLNVKTDVLMIKGVNNETVLGADCDKKIIEIANHLDAQFIIQFGMVVKEIMGVYPRITESTHEELINSGFKDITSRVFSKGEIKNINRINEILKDEVFRFGTGFFPGTEVRVYKK